MSKLAKAISAIDTVIMLKDDVDDFAYEGIIIIEAEVITYTHRFKDTLYGCTRGALNTTAVAHKKNIQVMIYAYYFPIQCVTSIKANSSDKLINDVVLKQGANVTLTQVGQEITIAATGGGSLTYPLTAPDGVNTAPSYAFASAPGTGMFLTNNELHFAQAQTDVFYMTTAACGPVSTAQFLPTFGSETTPGIAFSNGNTGLYGADPATLGIATNGTKAVEFDFSDSPATGDTKMLLWDYTTNMLQRVSVGANDSAGTGFRLLKIPNA